MNCFMNLIICLMVLVDRTYLISRWNIESFLCTGIINLLSVFYESNILPCSKILPYFWCNTSSLQWIKSRKLFILLISFCILYYLVCPPSRASFSKYPASCAFLSFSMNYLRRSLQTWLSAFFTPPIRFRS